MGRMELPLNTSKGCGGVMRVAPVGLALGVDDPFRLGCEVAALTHGHPTGQLAAGFLAQLVRDLLGRRPPRCLRRRARGAEPLAWKGLRGTMWPRGRQEEPRSAVSSPGSRRHPGPRATSSSSTLQTCAPAASAWA